MTVFVTKYALTQGIFECEVAPCSHETMVADKRPGRFGGFHKPFWHLTQQEAQAHAEQMRQAKIASLKKGIAKLEKLSF